MARPMPSPRCRAGHQRSGAAKTDRRGTSYARLRRPHPVHDRRAPSFRSKRQSALDDHRATSMLPQWGSRSGFAPIPGHGHTHGHTHPCTECPTRTSQRHERRFPAGEPRCPSSARGAVSRFSCPRGLFGGLADKASCSRSASSRPARPSTTSTRPRGGSTWSTASATALEDYYVGGDEARGEWLGQRRRASSGSRAPSKARRCGGCSAGSHPRDGVPLRELGRPVRVAGFDLTFSAPKSVSVALRHRRRRDLQPRSGRRTTCGASRRSGTSSGRPPRCGAGRRRSWSSRPTGSSRRRFGTARRAPAIRSCTRTCSSRTSGAAPTGGGRRSTGGGSTRTRGRRASSTRRCCAAS